MTGTPLSLLVIIVSSETVVTVITLFNEGKADTFALGEGDKWLLGVTNNENVGETSSERVTTGVLNMGNLIRTWMVLNMLKDTNTTDVVSAGDEYGGTIIEFDNAAD